MFVQEAENRFQTGLRHLSRGRAREALPFMGAAIEVQQETDAEGHGHATYLSYHGLCLCLTRSDMHAGVKKCRLAAKIDSINPEVWWNLGRVALILGHKEEAYRSFCEGLRMDPGHPRITRSIQRMGVRRPAVLSFLSRRNPINRLFGRLRGRGKTRVSSAKSPDVGRRSSLAAPGAYRLTPREHGCRAAARNN